MRGATSFEDTKLSLSWKEKEEQQQSKPQEDEDPVTAKRETKDTMEDISDEEEAYWNQ